MEEDTRPSRSSTVLEETFYTTSKKNTYYRVRLSEKGLSLQKESNGSTKTETINLRDITGCRCLRSKKRTGGSCACRPGALKPQPRLVESTEVIQPFEAYDASAYLYIYAYTMKKARVKGAARRERTTITLRFRSFDKYEDNLREASKWRLAIKCFISNTPLPKTLVSPSHNNLDTLMAAFPSESKKLLILLNPKSGQGRARETFQRRIHPILMEAEKPYDFHITKHTNYAREFVRCKDIYQWSGILVVGGDGIFFEVINGLLQRPDWDKALKELPLGVIPCGSGNGLAKSIAYANQEPYDHNPVLISSLAAVKFKRAPIDLVRVETRNQILYSFLSVGWGLISDIDIESESLRAMGAQRFTVWSLARLIGLRTYRGKVSYLPCDKYTVENSVNGDIKKDGCDYSKIAHSRSYDDELDRYGDIRESKSYHDVVDDGHVLNDVFNDIEENELTTDALALETEDYTRGRLDSFYSTTSKKSTYFSTGSVSSYHSFEDIDKSDDSLDNGIGSRVVFGPPSSLPALTAPVPNSWTEIEGEFVMVHAAYQTHLGQDCFFSPRGRLDDGIIWLLIIKAGITRANLFQFLLNLSTGTHLTTQGVDMVPVKAFRIEPAESSVGHMTVDGEKVDYGSIQAEVFPSLAQVMCP